MDINEAFKELDKLYLDATSILNEWVKMDNIANNSDNNELKYVITNVAEPESDCYSFYYLNNAKPNPFYDIGRLCDLRSRTGKDMVYSMSAAEQLAKDVIGKRYHTYKGKPVYITSIDKSNNIKTIKTIQE